MPQNKAMSSYRKEGQFINKIRDIKSKQESPNVYKMYTIKIKNQRWLNQY